MIFIIIVVVLVVLIAIYVGTTYNGLVKFRNLAEEAFSTMDVYLKKRWDLIPNIVESVKGYAKHEAETLEKVISARNMRYQDMSEAEKMKVDQELTRGISAINVLAEQYPDLKANENFLDLNRQLQKTEEDIANARKYYNASVRKLNDKIEMFPSSIIAGMFNFKKRDMFIVEDDRQREAVKVGF